MSQPIMFEYTNWNGKVAVRTVTPRGLRFGRTQWHRDEQWLMRGFDHDRGREREFALADCNFQFEKEI